ncbi:MAG: glycosyltransferase family 2 protein [Solidesulfovibrio sp.]
MLPDARASTLVTLSLVVPVFNEAEAVAIFLERIHNVFDGNASLRLEVVFINDGSTDDTLERLLALQTQDARVRIIDLSRHFGKEAALAAGLQTSTGQVVVPIDVDLQDPPELVLEMLEKWREGFDAVLGRRSNRGTDTFAKRLSATWFYRIHNWLSDLHLPENVGDFRLLDRTVVNALNSLPESHRFMKGLFAWAGFKTAYVDYVRPERVAGSSKFNGWRLWNFALEGITSFSTVPLRIWTYVGFAVALLSFFYGLRIAVNVLLHGIDVAGYASIFVAVTFLGGLQLMGIGVIGEYLGRTYHESKRRPVYLVRRLFEPAGASPPLATRSNKPEV